MPGHDPLRRDRFVIHSGRFGHLEAAWFRPRFWRGAGSTGFILPVPLLLAGSALLLALINTPSLVRRSRRRRRNRCLACGYQRAGDAACAECGLLPGDASDRLRPRPLKIVRDAAVLAFLILFLLAGFGWLFAEWDQHAAAVHRARILDYSWYLDATQPRVSGAVAVARPGDDPRNLGAVLRSVAPGTTVFLLPGVHDLGEDYPSPTRMPVTALADIWLVGSNPATTTLSLELNGATRVRIEGVTIECNNSPFLYLRAGGAVQLRNCRVQGYNSGAGGSNSIFAAGAVLLVERCTFEGRSGRAGGSNNGDAMDLRGDNRVFIRDTNFIDNAEIFRAAAGVLDRCKVLVDQTRSTTLPGPDSLFVRDSQFPYSTIPRLWTSFSEALDDPAVLKRLASGPGRADDWPERSTFEFARTLRLQNSPAFWERLLVHPAPEVRSIARANVDLPAAAALTVGLEQALSELDKDVLPPGAALALLRDTEGAREALTETLDHGPASQRANAAALLQLMQLRPGIPDVVERERLRRPR